jgi:polyhydroxyalkanoate synthesis regulator phasin
MNTESLGASLKKNWRQVAIGFATLVIIIITVFRIGGDDFVYAFNSNISSFQSLGILTITIILWVKMGAKSQNRLLWFGLLLGWALWAIAEWWWGISSFFVEEAPFPSVADFFWIIGYIPMFIALDARSRSIPEETTARQKLIIWLCSIIAVGVSAAFILEPAIASYEPGTFFETALTLFYPIGDLVLFVLVMRIAFKYQQGINGQAWAWISAGYVLLTVADLVFCYASTNNIYYPGGEVNFISLIGSDLLYSTSYMIIMFGLAIMRVLSKTQEVVVEPEVELLPVPNAHVLIFTDRNDLISDISKNYGQIFGTENVLGQPVSKVLGISPDVIANLISQVRTRRVLGEVAVPVITRAGEGIAQFSGETLLTPDGGYAGSILLVRLLMDDPLLDASLTDYQRSIIRSVMKKTGYKEEDEIKKLLTGYFSTLLKEYIDCVETEGGNLLGHSVLGKLESDPGMYEKKVKIDADGIMDTGDLSLEEARKAIAEVMKKAREITVEITDEAVVKKVEATVWSKMAPNIKQNLEQYGVKPPLSG